MKWWAVSTTDLGIISSIGIKPAFHFNRIVAYFIVSISLVLPECSQNNEYATFRYDTVEVENGLYTKHSSLWIGGYLALKIYTECIKKMVIELWSALVRSLYNLQKSFFNSRKDQAFSFRMSPFLWNLKKDWANRYQMEIAGRNHIFPPVTSYHTGYFLPVI